MIINEDKRLFIDILETKIQANDYKIMFVTLYDLFICICIKYKEKYCKIMVRNPDIFNYNDINCRYKHISNLSDKTIEEIKKELPKDEK